MSVSELVPSPYEIAFETVRIQIIFWQNLGAKDADLSLFFCKKVVSSVFHMMGFFKGGFFRLQDVTFFKIGVHFEVIFTL